MFASLTILCASWTRENLSQLVVAPTQSHQARPKLCCITCSRQASRGTDITATSKGFTLPFVKSLLPEFPREGSECQSLECILGLTKEFSWPNPRSSLSPIWGAMKKGRSKCLPLPALGNCLKAEALTLAPTYAKSLLWSSCVCTQSNTSATLNLTQLGFLTQPQACAVTAVTADLLVDHWTVL